MAAKTPRELANAKLLKTIGAFLETHKLDPVPENYGLVYHLCTDTESPVAKAIQSLLVDGLRLTQREANRVLEENGMDPRRGPSLDEAALSDARRQIEEFAGILETARAQASDYERDLTAGAAELKEHSQAVPAVAGLIRITGAMIERTRDAESQLAAARHEVQALREQLASAEQQARSDPLTRLPNRRAFEHRLDELQKKGGPLSLAICDIDRFKLVNDRYGHAVGDRVLRAVAEELERHCAGNMVARLGGEEFVVLFEGLAPADAALLLERVRVHLAGRQFRLRETDEPLGRVTFSAGLADGRVNGHAEPPLKRADTLLYAAKDGGRNQIRVEGL